MADTFKASDISLKVQKKLLSKMSTKSVAKTFLDDGNANILDNLYKLIKSYTESKKEAEKIVKDVIKIVVKIGILARNDQFTKEDLNIAFKLRSKFSVLVKTLISFFEVDFSFDRNFLTKNINDCRSLLRTLVKKHLSEKSLGRIDRVFDFFGRDTFLEDIFRRESKHRPFLKAVVDDMNKAVEKGDL